MKLQLSSITRAVYHIEIGVNIVLVGIIKYKNFLIEIVFFAA